MSEEVLETLEEIVDSSESEEEVHSEESQLSETEQSAIDDGWVPKDKYRGDPDKWVSAEEFVERGKHINKLLQAKLKRQDQEMADLRKGMDEFKKFSQVQIEKKTTELESALAELKSAKAEAIRNGDGEQVNLIDDQIDLAKDKLREAKAAPKQDAPALDPEIKADFDKWQSRNAWYGKDVEASKYTDQVAAKLIKQGETRVGMAFLRIVEEIVREDRPELFSNTNRTRPGTVSGSNGKVDTQSLESFKRSLPREDHDFMILGIKEGWFESEAEFMKQYKEL